MRNNSNNGLSATMVLRFINSQLGTSVHNLELTPKEMMRIVYQQSVPIFSKYWPFYPMVTLEDSDKIQGSRTEYRLPNPWNLQIHTLHKHYLGSAWRAGGWVMPIVQNPIDSQLLADSASMYVTPILPEYHPPNKIVIKQNMNNMYSNISLVFKATHPNHLKTIQPNLREDFLKLCLYDVLIAIYPMRHRFNTINTPYGSLEPFMEMVDNAASQRSDLIEKWKVEFLNAGDNKKLWIA